MPTRTGHPDEPGSAEPESAGPALGLPARRVLLVASSGGHLTQLLTLEPWWRDKERTWVTCESDHARSLLRDERIWWGYFPTTRSVPNLLRNAALSIRVLRRERPDVVVSTGAGIAVPFFVAARALGIPTVFIEVYDRIDLPTLTARLCRPFTSLLLVQWEQQRRSFPEAEVVGHLL